MKSPPKILISRLSAIGDVVRTVPAVKALREFFPTSEIHWLIEDRCASIIDGLSYIDKLQQVPRKKWRGYSPLKKIVSFENFIRSLRAEKYDIYLDFHGILKSGLYGFLAGIPRRIGYPGSIAKEGNTLFTNEKILAHSSHTSRYARNFLMAQHFRESSVEKKAALPISAADRRFADNFLKQQGLQAKQYVCIFPGSSKIGRYKRWPPKNYSTLINLLKEKCHIPTIIAWGPGEEEIVQEVVKNTKKMPIILPLTTLKQLCAILEQSTLFIGGDTGPMHMASMVGTPVVTIFGPSDRLINEPARFTPFEIVHAGVDCSPCRKKSCRELLCLHAIKPAIVLKTAKKILAQTSS